jgi:hypothetical protein
MRAILLPDRDLLTHYAATDGEQDNPAAEALSTEIHSRGLDTWRAHPRSMAATATGFVGRPMLGFI